MPATPKPKSDDPDDIFADSRMSFGDHIEELRYRLLKAVKGLVFCLVIGFILDGIGYSLGWDNFGIGRPMTHVINKPVNEMVRDYYYSNLVRKQADMISIPRTSPEEAERIKKKITEGDGLYDLSTDEMLKLRGMPETMQVIVPVESLQPAFGKPNDPNLKEIEVPAYVYPVQVAYLSAKGEGLLANKNFITSLSAQEPLVVYFKVSLLCGFVIGSPYIFYQLWAFVAAGLYPHERRYVHVYLPASVISFLTGVLLCQFVVLPGAVKALLGFNRFIDVDPDIRLNEWLGFALILPLVFGLSFQTPLVMMFLNRIGVFGWQDYLARWRGAVMVLAVFSALITPTPDVITMLYLFVPMFGLYMLGIAICKYFPPPHEQFADEDAEQVAV